MNTRLELADVVIVGAGMTGLTAARKLQDAGKDVVILDKGHSVGGRMATRRIGSGLADHGAQFFTVREPVFQQMVDGWLEEGLVFLWSRGFSDNSLSAPSREGNPRYAVKGGMNALTQRMGQDLKSIYVNTRVSALRFEGDSWRVEDSEGGQYNARAVIMTPPVPQTLELLRAGQVTLHPDDKAALEAITYNRCVVGLFHIKGSVRLPAPGAIQRRDAPVSFIANNKQKGISGETILTAQANADYSLQLWDDDDERVTKALLTHMRMFLPDKAEIVEAQIKRWRYSSPATRHEGHSRLAQGLPTLVFGGDAFCLTGPRVEAAVLSGLEAAEMVLARL